MTNTTPFVPTEDYFRTRYTGTPFPFTEDEDGWIYGYGHQDKDQFASAVNTFDILSGQLEDEAQVTTSADVEHKWALAMENSTEEEPFWAFVPADFAPHPLVFALTVVER